MLVRLTICSCIYWPSGFPLLWNARLYPLFIFFYWPVYILFFLYWFVVALLKWDTLAVGLNILNTFFQFNFQHSTTLFTFAMHRYFRFYEESVFYVLLFGCTFSPNDLIQSCGSKYLYADVSQVCVSSPDLFLDFQTSIFVCDCLPNIFTWRSNMYSKLTCPEENPAFCATHSCQSLPISVDCRHPHSLYCSSQNH